MMFRINIICIGKNKDKWIDDSINHYSTLLKKYTNITFDYISANKLSKAVSADELSKLESELISKRLKTRFQIALSERGKSLDSIGFSKWLAGIMKTTGSSDFIIGGINGLDESFMKSCDEFISLSPLTMSHQLVRPVLLEQLYRAFNLLSGGKYHR